MILQYLMGAGLSTWRCMQSLLAAYCPSSDEQEVVSSVPGCWRVRAQTAAAQCNACVW